MTHTTQMEPKKIVMTLGEIRAFQPCPAGWNQLIKYLKASDDGVVVSLKTILHNNGESDAIWCFRVNWFEHKKLYMDFVNNCVYEFADAAADAAIDTSAVSAVRAAANAAYAAANAANAANAASVTIDIANYFTIKNRSQEEKRQFQYLNSLLLY